MFGIFYTIRSLWISFLDDRPRLEKAVAAVSRWLPPLNFITIHYAYIIIGCMLSSLVFWCCSAPFGSVHYVDCLFLVTSAMTNTGLNTINLSPLTVWQQVMLALLMMIGSPIWVSIWTVLVRKHAFERRFESIVEAVREMDKKRAAAAGPFTPRLIRALSFGRYRTEPVPEPSMPGLGARQKSVMSDGGYPPIALPDIRTRLDENAPANPEEPSRPVFEGPPDTAQSADDNALNGATREHIVFAAHLQRPSADHAPTRDSIDRIGRLATHDSGNSSTETDNTNGFRFHWKKILGSHNVTRTGQFYGLTAEERSRLGGCEYRALKVLAIIVPLYLFLWHFLGALALGSWMHSHGPAPMYFKGNNRWWTGIFMCFSAFNNSGFSLIDENMIPFQGAYFVLITVALLILAGNTAFPVFLRFILWTLLKLMHLCTPDNVFAEWKETLEFTLKYPRRVYTTLFASNLTWWLFGVVIATNVVGWLAFELLDIGNSAVESLPIGNRIIDGLFQAIAVRNAGFVVIEIPTLYIGVQVIYVVMMYISVYPVVISMRHSNVYEERSLGIYDEHPDSESTEGLPYATVSNDSQPNPRDYLRRRNTAATNASRLSQTVRTAAHFQGVGARRRPQPHEENSRFSFIQHQIRGQLAHDLWWLVIAAIIIIIIETDHFLAHPVVFSVFNVFFEVVSAYGTVGLSVGLPNQTYSFSGGWHTASKVLLCFVMVRGRHRGLPVALDRAVRLPGENLALEEEEDHLIRRARTVPRRNSYTPQT